MDISGEDASIDDDSEWSSYDDEEEPHAEEEADAVNALQELSGQPRHGQTVFGDDDGDDIIYSTRPPQIEDSHRGYTSEDDDDDDDEEESMDGEFQEDSDNYFEFNNAFSRLGRLLFLIVFVVCVNHSFRWHSY
jgi:hypothetical protein